MRTGGSRALRRSPIARSLVPSPASRELADEITLAAAHWRVARPSWCSSTAGSRRRCHASGALPSGSRVEQPGLVACRVRRRDRAVSRARRALRAACLCRAQHGIPRRRRLHSASGRHGPGAADSLLFVAADTAEAKGRPAMSHPRVLIVLGDQQSGSHRRDLRRAGWRRSTSRTP